jgi:anti-sigma regulatory factor (Ser/Thr protein kinase)
VTDILSLRLPPSPEAVRDARVAMNGLEDVVRPRSLDDVRLLVSELVTNSLRHGRLPRQAKISVRISLIGHALRVEVTDPGPGFDPAPITPSIYQTSGWGLYLVGQIADRWGVRRGGGTVVWFELDEAARSEKEKLTHT